YNDLHAGRNLGQLYIILDPARFGDADTFRQHISQTMEELNAIKPAEGFSNVRYPGQGSNDRYERNKSQGVEIPESIIEYLKSDVIHNDSYEGLSPFAN
ncbi:MAG: Ldh family oxidoreductase, partial [Trichococcus flocculiformis]